VCICTPTLFETIATVMLLARNKSTGRSCSAQLRLAEPTLLLPGDRFIMRQFSPVVTVGGGVVLDAIARFRAGWIGF